MHGCAGLMNCPCPCSMTSPALSTAAWTSECGWLSNDSVPHARQAQHCHLFAARQAEWISSSSGRQHLDDHAGWAIALRVNFRHADSLLGGQEELRSSLAQVALFAISVCERDAALRAPADAEAVAVLRACRPPDEDPQAMCSACLGLHVFKDLQSLRGMATSRWHPDGRFAR